MEIAGDTKGRMQEERSKCEIDHKIERQEESGEKWASGKTGEIARKR
ncbi:9351_t:CDS:2 [Rhizophagus irregularis]|nr:9351_t:CDS:2 [Rhizophagus irregularis]